MRAAIIGCGAISKNHIDGILKAGHSLCALCDIDAAAAKDKNTAVPVYTDYSAMLDEIKPDCVHICTPHHLHADMCIAALARGIHVLCEKPLTTNLADLDRILAAERSSSATLGVCLQNRYEPSFIALKEHASNGVLSACGSVFWCRDEAYYTSGQWRGKWETEGGGVAINQAIHTLDLLQHLGGMPEYITAHCFNDHLKDVIEVEDTVCARMETEDGKVLTFFATTACGASFPAEIRLKTADKKTLIATCRALTVNGNPLPHQEEKTAGKEDWGNGHTRLIADFYRHLEAGLPFPIDGEEGGKALRLVLSIYSSRGQRIPVL